MGFPYSAKNMTVMKCHNCKRDFCFRSFRSAGHQCPYCKVMNYAIKSETCSSVWGYSVFKGMNNLEYRKILYNLYK